MAKHPLRDFIFSICKEKKITQQCLAEKLGISAPKLSQIANGVIPLSINVALDLELALGVRAIEFLEIQLREKIRKARLVKMSKGVQFPSILRVKKE
jgi:transcriptional regulator with XRE-family HTH domain